MTDPVSKVFISHSHKQATEVRQLESALEQVNIEAWAYESDLSFGKKIMDEVENHIREADHFLIFLSNDSQDSHWVAKELGLALERQEQSNAKYPSIIGVIGAKEPESLEYRPVDFHSGKPLDFVYDFAIQRSFKIKNSVDKLDDLVNHLLPRVTHITETDGDQGILLSESFKCYEKLFPDEGERDDPEDIITWIDESRRANISGHKWCEFYAVLHILDHVIGIIFLSGHTERSWCFGNYFGVSRAWRQQKRAEWFLEHVRDKLLSLLPHVQGVIFEVDPIDLEFLERVALRHSLLGYSDEAKLVQQLRNLRRIQLYGSYGAMTLVDMHGIPIPYWQPAMAEPLGPDNERQLILMVFPFVRGQLGDIKLDEILDFIYDDVFGDAYGGVSDTEISGFNNYCVQVKRRVNQNAEQGYSWGRLSIPKTIRRLIHRANEEGLRNRIAL
ncbi:MAG: toll/interleukin-1 receptor domain-containing protein [Gammaproteobacteria bacterium]|jgi:hypothetical protein|nr:toll/interleukin-1 receptor domain-containing protein [Gammaproteobacteria bacterium]MBT3725725.1 toll/interleukin-1 receptor domain-containing protein [Gammaproteobacteria bacterium]MBT4076402.1 toll/interleukin-1 receptor domain-containing protein [Gammaproteobacteria bacterium]MBT4195481.1 toll/interleukin-1 receptor domain-containing protein [Gammaproteobacteria bacterium]MBT4449412.1 toll/interleukin-1 receptor domain-containing protein [Gammaproteobacteria bacterium]